jgi:DNA processing protein
VPEFTPRRWRRFLRSGGRAAELASPEARSLGNRLGIGRKEAGLLARALVRTDPAREQERAGQAGIEIDVWGAPGYPGSLLQLEDPPPALFRRGELLPCDERAVAIIGSRRATRYGLRVARILAGDLARAGVTIVAGLARGIDGAAHEAALDAGGRTVAVLGSGLLEPYPPEHVFLLERVVAGGAVLSEFPLRAPPLQQHFPRRNRLLAALSAAVLVVEAALRSGTHGTVRHALDLGRSVLAVPGAVDSAASQGTLRMLQEGAAPVGCAEDVFAALGWCSTASTDLPEDERALLDALPEEGATADEMSVQNGLREEVAAGLLLTLEVRGLVERCDGGRYVARG